MSDLHPVGIVGAGTMGIGLAQIAASAGHGVRLFDSRPGAAAAAAASVRQTLEKLAAKGKILPEAAAAAAARLAPAAALADLADCGLVIEAIVEELAAKRGLFGALEAVVTPSCLLATNTSSLSIPAIASGLRAPGRLGGMHFFNPAPLMDLVEIVGGVATDAGVLEALAAQARAWGKTPVQVRSTPGFLVNRVARPFYAEGMRLLAEQAADAATIDAVMRECGGFRMGPLELTDLIGQDVNFAVTRAVWEGFFGDARFRPSLLQQELVAAGWLGRKTGRGFYAYGEGAVPPQPQTEAPQPKPERIALTGDEAAVRALAQRMEHAGVEVARPPHLQLPTDVLLHIGDGRTAAELEQGRERRQPTALVDLALDYSTARRVAVALSPHCQGAVRAAAIGALQAGGLAVSCVADLPGLVVLRTVAMLINEAADAVHFGIASAADVDIAMRKGVNYPLGPLEWADKLGMARVHGALAHLAAFYGEDRYRVSPRLRQLYRGGGKFLA